MFKILAAHNIPERLVKVIMLICKDLIAKVVSPDGDTDYFDIPPWSNARRHSRTILICDCTGLCQAESFLKTGRRVKLC